MLKELGEELPSSNPIDEQIVLKEFMAVGQQLSTYPGQALLQHSRMTDPRKLAAMEFLQSILSPTANGLNYCINVWVTLRLIKITLESGLCESSAFAFAAFSCTYLRGSMKGERYQYGLLSCSSIMIFRLKTLFLLAWSSDIDKAYYLGTLAIQIQNILESDKVSCHTFDICIHAGFLTKQTFINVLTYYQYKARVYTLM